MSTRSAHSEIINPAIACIYDQALTSIVGTGFTLTEKHVVTCAHVVNAALGRKQDETTRPNETAQIRLAFMNSLHPELCRELVAKVVKWLPQERGFYDLDDIAILELLDVPKPLALPKLVRLEERDYFSQRAFKAFGFNISEGSWAHGQIGGLIASDTIQLNMERPIEEGFSGAPVWDKTECGVIGMLISIREDYKTAYMIPLSRLLEVFPDADQITIPRNPYRGLALFEEQHAQDFFGREQVTKDLMQKVTQSPFVLLLGISGSGKSSLLNAGLTYQLHQQGYWLVIKVRPFNQPFQDLARGFLTVLYTDPIERAIKEKNLPTQLAEQTVSLASLCHSALQAKGKERLLLIVDQFEELYTHTSHKQTQAKYLDSLLSLLSDANGKITLLLALRADFMAQLSTYAPLIQAVNTYSAHQLILSGMSEEELHHAIVKPAQTLGVELEQGLAERMLQELAEDSTGQLPLLEFALTELWNRQRGRRLTHQALDEIGGVAHALAQHAEHVFKNYSAAQQQAIKRIMVKLIVPGAGAEDTRQVARFSDFTVDDQALLPQLAGERLIVTGSQLEDEQPTVEVIHEALIREWGRLRGWMDEHREFRIWEERLKQRLADWVKHEKANDGLLTGRYLLEAQEYLGSHVLMLGAEAQDFIRLSAKVEKRQRRTRQGIVAGFMGVISLAAALAVWQWQEATHAAERAQQAELAAKTEAEKAKQSENKANEATQQALQSEETAKQEAEKSKESEKANLELATAMLDYLVQQNRKVLDGYIQFIQDKNLTSPVLSLLAPSINNTESIDSNEKQYWRETLPTMTRGQKIELLKILIKERKELYELGPTSESEREKFYQQALEADSTNANILGNFANFMTDIRHNHDEAEKLYRQAIEANPKHANILGNFANFMTDVRQNYDEAEKLYRRAIEADPNDTNTLGNFANFMTDIRHNHNEAEKLYRQAIEANPKHANNLDNFAIFMWQARQNHDEAEKLYRQAIEANPKHANILGNFAIFMKNIRQNYDEAEKLYRQAIEANPKHANTLGNFANFMTDIRHNHNEAEKLYRQAIEANPKHANTLGNFAIFMWQARQNYDEAEKLYQRAIEADPKHANNLGNFAQLKLAKGDYIKGKELLDRSFAANNGKVPLLDMELWFYCLAHFPNDYPEAKDNLLTLLKTPENREAWDFSPNIDRAKQDGNPHVPFLQAVAEVINSRADFDTLKPYLTDSSKPKR